MNNTKSQGLFRTITNKNVLVNRRKLHYFAADMYIGT